MGPAPIGAGKHLRQPTFGRTGLMGSVPVIQRLDDVRMDEVRLTTPVADADLARLKLGDVVYLDGVLYTAQIGRAHV